MNFTRDPIIETVITPREGCKLVVRSSKGANQEDYLVDALEVVSFGHSFFFRSLERPKSFLVPVTDYEIFELKEPKMALKNATADRSIKIGGGRDVPPRVLREAPSPESKEEDHQSTQSLDRKSQPRDKQRRRGRRGRDRHDGYHQAQEGESLPKEEPALDAQVEKSAHVDEPKEKAPSFISKLFPPPTTLIKETLSRYKSPDPASEDLIPPKDPISVEEKEFFEESYIDQPVDQDSVSEE